MIRVNDDNFLIMLFIYFFLPLNVSWSLLNLAQWKVALMACLAIYATSYLLLHIRLHKGTAQMVLQQH